jgi:hypothetical protein
MAEKQSRWAGWAEKRAEEKRLKLQRTGDSPEKAVRHRKPGDKDPMDYRKPNSNGGAYGGGFG